MTIQKDDPRFWDVRTLERKFRKGQISKKDYEKHLKGLPDVAEKQAPVDLAAADDDDDLDDDLDDEDEDDDEDDAADAGANGVHE